MTNHDAPEKNYDLERLIFFSDGVFAIAITLLAIELHPPHDWDGKFLSLVSGIGKNVIFYLISFFAIGAFWMSHRMMFRYVRSFNETASWINLLFLALIGLIPLANILLGIGMRADAVWIYVGLMIVISMVGGLLWAYLGLIAKVVDPRLTTGFKLAMLFRLSIVPPIMCGASLWVGARYGLWPSAIFAAIIILLSSRVHFKAFKEEAAETPTA